MHHDARMYIEVRYDGQTADAVLVLFRDTGIPGIAVHTEEFSFDSPELSEDHQHEAMMNLFAIIKAIQERR